MWSSLEETVAEIPGTQSAILQSLNSPQGLNTVWIVVESEDDFNTYKKFMHPESTQVKSSEDNEGRKGYDNVVKIVTEIKRIVPGAHIMGIRDTDYTRYEDGYEAPANIFMTDHRDLEMMMLKSDSVNQSLRAWAPAFNTAWDKCIPICRHFGYLRIFNSLKGFFVSFHDNLNTVKYWDDNIHDLKANWEQESTSKFVSLAEKGCSADSFVEFVTSLSLDKEDFFNICRGHDLIPVLSKALIRNHIYSEANIMNIMIEAYSMDDFRATQLYASILAWQAEEGVIALAA